MCEIAVRGATLATLLDARESAKRDAHAHVKKQTLAVLAGLWVVSRGCCRRAGMSSWHGSASTEVRDTRSYGAEGRKAAERAGGSAGDGMGAEVRADSAAARHMLGSPHQVGGNGQHKVIAGRELQRSVMRTA